ncbi:hypothetical protein R1sor_007328 [Riccia sorocarpa]|uniref:CRAL-TRIO domain-containing protein n=1 Tax=Riccia sorocarpa TaxID=122646 RepID=A0ABD3HQ57_9MARC
MAAQTDVQICGDGASRNPIKRSFQETGTLAQLGSSPTDRDDLMETDQSLEWDAEQQSRFTEKRRLSQFATDRKLSLKITTPPTSLSDYESEGDVTPGGTPSSNSKRWQSFKIGSIFSRFHRQSAMPSRAQTPDSPSSKAFCGNDDMMMLGGSRSFMVPYDAVDSDLQMASPKKIISIRGLIKVCGRDACGRPIVVIDTSYCPPPYMRFAALGHIREKMEPIVEAGEYNLVFVMSPNPSKGGAHKEVPTMWCLDVYRKLPYAYKKNVRRIVFIHPTFFVNLVLNCLRPFISGKAHEKIVRVHQLADLEKVSDGDISLDKLYLAPHVYLHDKSLAAAENPEDYSYE